MDYENAVTEAFKDHRIVTLCSYNLTKCRPTNVLEVVRNHQSTLHRRDSNWEVIVKGGGPRVRSQPALALLPILTGNHQLVSLKAFCPHCFGMTIAPTFVGIANSGTLNRQ